MPGEPSPQLAEIYREHHTFVWRSLQRLGVPESAVPDAVHDTFLVAARRLHEFSGRSNIRTWLFAIALRVAQSFRRDHQRRDRREALGEDLDHHGHDHHARGDAAIDLLQLLDLLDDDKRTVFILTHLEGMTAPEIATALGIKLPTVYSRLRLARLTLEQAVAAPPARRPSP